MQALSDSVEYVTESYLEEKTITPQENHIPIYFILNHPDELQFGEPMRYKSYQSNDSLIIFPSSHNYNGAKSGKRYEVPMLPFFEYSEDVEYLSLDAVIINTTDEPLLINKFVLEVESSDLDKSPYLYLCTVEDTANTLIISDESWTDFGGFTLEYSLLKKDEKFNGKYEKEKVFKNTCDSITVDFTEDMTQMGYDFAYLKDKYMSSYYHYMIITSEDELEDPSSLFEPFEWTSINALGVNFYLGFCRMVGRIVFHKGYPPIEFSARLSLSTMAGFGADFDYNDYFDFELQPDKKSYKVEKPYNTTIRPQASEKIALKIKCEKSSFHKFKLRAVSDSDVDISGTPISLHYMMPRHAIQTIH